MTTLIVILILIFLLGLCMYTIAALSGHLVDERARVRELEDTLRNLLDDLEEDEGGRTLYVIKGGKE
jgi:hypothetical protein